jgi:hypothetical protein
MKVHTTIKSQWSQAKLILNKDPFVGRNLENIPIHTRPPHEGMIAWSSNTQIFNHSQ